MAYAGIHSLTADEAANVLVGGLGFDEVDFTEHLTNGATVAASEWDVTHDLKTASGSTSITVTDDADKDLAAFFTSELLTSLQVLQPEANRIFTASTMDWENHDIAPVFETTGDHLRVNSNAAGQYFKLAAGYAPMVADQVYEMTLYCTDGGWSGTGFEFQDYGGRALVLTADTPTGTPGGNFDVTSRPVNVVYQFKAPTGTSGGFRVVSKGIEAFYFDNWELVNVAAKEVVAGMVFKVTATGDTKDDALANAKGSAPAENDLFAITAITTKGDELMPNVEDRDFSAASEWLKNTMNAYDEETDGVLTITASVAGQYCTLIVDSAPMTAGTAYRIQLDLSSINGSWLLQDFTGVQTFATITANGDDQTFDFTVDTAITGGYRLTAVDSDSSGVFDNFSLKAGKGEVVYVGNAVGSYAFSAASLESTLIQTAANRASAGLNVKGRNLKEYALTYTIGEVNQEAKNISACVNKDYDTFSGASATGFTAAYTTSGTQEAGTADEIVVVSGRTYGVSFTLTYTSGALPAVKIVDALAGTTLVAETDTVAEAGSNTLTFTASADGTGAVQFSNTAAASYAISSLKVYDISRLPDGDFALTLETFSRESVAMPFTNGAQAVYFLSASDADAADLKIQAASASDTTGGVFSISALTLFRCCDSGVSAADVAWWKVRAISGNATFAGVSLAGDNPTSDELAEHQIREGIFSRITGTAGVIHAYRTAYRD